MRHDGKFTLDYSIGIDERINMAKKILPFKINIHPWVFYSQENEDKDIGLINHHTDGKVEYAFKLFEFPENTSKKMMHFRIRKSGFFPANPIHMRAFAEYGFKKNASFGEYHSYVVGLGGELQTVLGAQFGGLNSGMCFFFQHVPQHKRKHHGGRNDRFLCVQWYGMPDPIQMIYPRLP